MKTTPLFLRMNETAQLLRGWIIVLLLSAATISCQEDFQLAQDHEGSERQKSELRSAAITVAEIDALIAKIEDYAASGMLQPGIANSLISKLQNAKKSLEKGNGNALLNQVQSVINQLADLIGEGTIDEAIGEELLEDAIDIPAENTDCGGSITDPRDGKIYQTVKIGAQCWMAENLAYLPSVTPYPVSSDLIPYYYVYDYWYSNVEEARMTTSYLTYGTLYNWPAAVIACPPGWHLPSLAEWYLLAQYIDGLKGPYEYDGWEWKELGIHLKATSGWDWDGNGTDDFGFKGMPGGQVYGRYPQSQGHVGAWWISTVYEGFYSWFVKLYSNSNTFVNEYKPNYFGFSIRCVKDN